MGADGSRGPKPYQQVSTSTKFLRVPVEDWPLVKRGLKTEFRGAVGRASPLAWAGQLPTPVVAYRVDRMGRYDHTLMVLEEAWVEELGAITRESLTHEGFTTFAAFREAWCRRERRYFDPTRRVFAYRVRPWTPDDRAAMADALLERLYGEFL